MLDMLKLDESELSLLYDSFMKDSNIVDSQGESAVDENGNFKKFSLYEDVGISYALNASTK